MSAQNVTSTLRVTLTSTEVLTLGTASLNVPDQLIAALSWANGSAAGQVDQHWEQAAVTLAAGATADYTLSALLDTLGRTEANVHGAVILIFVTSRTAGDFLTLGDPTGALAHAFTGFLGGATQSVKVYDLFLIAAGGTDGYPIAAGSNDVLRVKNSGSNPITFKIAVVGRDA